MIFAMGANPKKLGLPDEKRWTGKGLHYCAACDGMFYKGKTVVVVGGGNSAAADALLLSRICKKVIVVHRREQLRATKVYHQPLMQAKNVEFQWNQTVKAVVSQDESGKMTGVRLEDVQTGEEKEVACDAVFVSVAERLPHRCSKRRWCWMKMVYIIADESTKTKSSGSVCSGRYSDKSIASDCDGCCGWGQCSVCCGGISGE